MSKSKKAGEPSMIIQVGVVFVMIAAIALVAVAAKMYTP